jgi:hypothetical protein
MKHPLAVAALFLITGTAVPAFAAPHGPGAIELAQYHPAHRQSTHPRQVSRNADSYNNAHASARSRDATHAINSRDTMPPGWKCIDRGGQDPSVFPSWQFCK